MSASQCITNRQWSSVSENFYGFQKIVFIKEAVMQSSQVEQKSSRYFSNVLVSDNFVVILCCESYTFIWSLLFAFIMINGFLEKIFQKQLPTNCYLEVIFMFPLCGWGLPSHSYWLDRTATQQEKLLSC